jgi:hypothetical protein
MIYQLVITILLMGLLLTAWIGFQSWVRRQSPWMRPDTDVLQGRFSCGTCISFEECHIVLTQPQRDSVSDTEIMKIDRSDEVALQ